MKGLKTVSNATQKTNSKDKSTWIPLYYNIKEQKVYSQEGDGRGFLTYLINPVTPKEIEDTVVYMMNM